MRTGGLVMFLVAGLLAAPVMLQTAPPALAATSHKLVNGTININTADAAQLRRLPGIGKVRSAKIVKNRPYKTPEDLVTRKVLPKGVFTKIKAHLAI